MRWEDFEPYDPEEIYWHLTLDRQMDFYKQEAIKKFAGIIKAPYTEAIAVTIALGYENQENECTTQILDDLQISDKHLAALTDDCQRMKEILLSEQEENYFYAVGEA